MDGREEDFTVLSNPGTEAGRSSDPEPDPIGDLETGDQTFDVGQLAYTRSGDKANSANIGELGGS